MSSSKPSSSSLANSIKRPSSGSKPPEAKKVSRPDGSSRPVTSSGKIATSSAVRTSTASARPEKPKQPVQGVKKEEPGSKGKEAIRSAEAKTPASTSTSRNVTAVSKSDVKNKTPTSTSKTDTKTTKTTKKAGTRAKKEKKNYALPGQKHDPPEEREPLRIFYESLSKQIPTSEMAEFWMMEHGLLSPEKAKKAYEKKQKKQHQLRTGTPVKSAVKLDRPESSKKVQSVNNGDMKAKKRVRYSDDDDDDFIVRTKKSKV